MLESMSGTHRADLHRLHRPGDSPIHRLAPEAKVLGTVVFTVVVACTPRHAVTVLVLDAVVLASIVALARLPVLLVLSRLTAILPFVVFAVVIPFVAHGPRTEVAGVSLSVEGLWATWNVIAKAGLGATAAIIVSSTTSLSALLEGLERLRVPRVLVAIVASMVRYLELLAGQLGRMRTAMTARGHDPRWLWQAGPIASSVGVLFVRSYERGERVHAAMLARGFTGAMTPSDRTGASAGAWALGIVPAALALTGLVGWMVLP